MKKKCGFSSFLLNDILFFRRRRLGGGKRRDERSHSNSTEHGAAAAATKTKREEGKGSYSVDKMDTNELGGEGLPKADDLNDEHYCDLESGVPSDAVGGDHSDRGGGREEKHKESEVQHLRDSIASAPSYLEVPGKNSPAGSHNTSAGKGNVSLKGITSLNF